MRIEHVRVRGANAIIVCGNRDGQVEINAENPGTCEVYQPLACESVTELRDPATRRQIAATVQRVADGRDIPREASMWAAIIAKMCWHETAEDAEVDARDESRYTRSTSNTGSGIDDPESR